MCLALTCTTLVTRPSRDVPEGASSDGLIKVNNDEYFTLSVNSFYCYNDFTNVIIIVIVLIYIVEMI